MSIHDITATRELRAIREAAARKDSVRLMGTVTATGDGHSGAYRNRWIQVEISPGVHVQMGASTKGTLGHLPIGSTLDVVVELTGMHDLSTNTYFGRRARLIAPR